MIIFQIVVGLFLSGVAIVFLGTARRGGESAAPEVCVLGCAWLPVFSVLLYGYGLLTGLTVHLGVGDSPEVSLNDGYSLILMDGVDGLLCRGPEKEQLVMPIVSIGETATHFYGVTRSGAFAVEKASGIVLEGGDLGALGSASFEARKLSPVGQFPGRPATRFDYAMFLLMLIGPLLTAWLWLRFRQRRGGGEDRAPAAGA